jgi:hypothetical protein
MKKALLAVLVVLMAAPVWAKVIYEDEFVDLGNFVFPFHDATGTSQATFEDVAGVPHGHGPECVHLSSSDGNQENCKMAIYMEEDISVRNGVITALWNDADVWVGGSDNDGSLYWRQQDPSTLPLSRGDQFIDNNLRGGYWMEQDMDGGFQFKMLLNGQAAANALGLDEPGGYEYTGSDRPDHGTGGWSLRDSELGLADPTFKTNGAWNTSGWIYHRFWMKDDRMKGTFWSSDIGDENIDMSIIQDMGDAAGIQYWVDAEGGWALDLVDILFEVFPEGYLALGAWSGESYWAWLQIDDDPDNPDYASSVESSSWGSIKYQY